jgi:opacity protein-like surface antigen
VGALFLVSWPRFRPVARGGMQKQMIGSSVIIAVVVATSSATAGDSGIDPFPVPRSSYNWNGFYAGLTAGAIWGQYDPRTSTNASGLLGFAAATIDAAGTQTIKPIGFVNGIEGGYNWKIGSLSVGMEANLQSLNFEGATNSGAVSYPARIGQFTVTSYGNTNWLFTARPRIGFMAPNEWLLYSTGGLALTQLQSDFSFADSNGALESGRLGTTKVGYAVGAGLEVPLTKQLSIETDYLYVNFGSTPGVVTAQTSSNPLFSSQFVFAHSSDLKADIFRAGLNYRFAGSDGSPSSNPIMPLKAPILKVPPSVKANWEVETGARLWLSSGTLGAPNPFFAAAPSTYGSRLTFSKLDAITGEVFARVDANGLFVKSFIGASGIANGQENDEDTLIPARGPYSNTQSSSSGEIGYATVDIGYNFLRSPAAKVGAFVGYNYYAQAINDYGCAQLAGGTECVVPSYPSSFLGVTENDHLNSMRVGLSSEVMLSDRLKLTTEASYLPRVTYGGLDDHLLRQLLYLEDSNSGNGVMLEAKLDYKITDAWRIGVGGRYWAWNMNTGTFNATPIQVRSATR